MSGQGAAFPFKPVRLRRGNEFGDGQGSLVCCSPWDRKESDTTEQLTSKLTSKQPTYLPRGPAHSVL